MGIEAMFKDCKTGGYNLEKFQGNEQRLLSLPQFYIDYLKTYLPSSELLTLQILVWLLQIYIQVRIERLAYSVLYPIKCESRRKNTTVFNFAEIKLAITLVTF